MGLREVSSIFLLDLPWVFLHHACMDTATDTTQPTALAGNLRARRLQLRLSQHLLSVRVSSAGQPLHATEVSRYENGASTPGVHRLAAIAEVLLCTVDDLLASPFTLEPPPGF